MGQEDMALNLDICDRIRSKQVPPKEAMRALKKRLQHKNPNVQLLALKLSDVCVKNGGGHFLAEVASREFVDALVVILNNTTTAQEVRSKTLALLQSWASAFKSRSDLNYMVDTYNSLKNSGVQFPPVREKTGAIMIDTAAPPDWTDSDVCDRCRSLFTLTNRKHHCRNCGKTFCQPCSARSTPLLQLGITQPVRVCEGCYQKVNGGSSSEPVSPVTNTSGSNSYPGARSAVVSSTGSSSKEDEELQKAIALSLLENEKNSDSARLPRKEVSYASVAAKKDPEEVEDPELAAAIAASLKDVKINKPQQYAMKDSMYPSTSSGSSSSSRVKFADEQPPLPVRQTSVPAAQDGNISSTECQNIALFYELMEKMDADSTGAASAGMLTDRDLRNLYETMTSLHPKLVKNIEECVEKHRVFMDLHEKLTNGVRTYDRLLDDKSKQQAAAQLQAAQQAHAQAYNPQSYYGQPPPQYGPTQHQPGYGTSPYYAPPQQQHQQAPPPQQQQPTGYYTPQQQPYQQYAPQQQAGPPQHQQQQYNPAPPPVSYASAASYSPAPAHQQASPQQQQQQQPAEPQQRPAPPQESKPLIEF